ncbi:hypothetical protein KFL_002230030 [Klebsormidium nitens]|uniref:C2H2-type domain-containing protein n=1 Tax=Klebsormidium nitens TaxID=105231 RepID=A0A1Y1I5F3_KLENI|nr:hypothetical protein KFL_002230030 [Klebsormidium nitens]|eukprot:GAQ85182.1 hypothetical protein KFL_002230030 [Klebsormidium nitens]
MGKKNKGRAAGPAKVAVSGPSEIEIVRFECEKAIKSLKNNPQRAQKTIKETCQRHPNVSLGFRYHAYIERRLAEHQHDASALKKRHVTAALEAANRATVLSPNSMEHGFFYATLLQEYMPLREGRERNVEAVAECERALAIAEPTDPAEDMLDELPEELRTAEVRIAHFKHQLRQLSCQIKLTDLQNIFKNGSVDANGNFVPLTTKVRTEMGSAQPLSEQRRAEKMEKTSKAEVEQISQREEQPVVRDEEQEEQQGGDEGEKGLGEISKSQNDGTEETLSEVKGAHAKKRQDLGQVSSSEPAQPLNPGESGKASSPQEEVMETDEEDENTMECKECDATFTSANEYLAHHNVEHPSLPPDELIVPVDLPANFDDSERRAALRETLTTVRVAIARRRLLLAHQHKIFQYLVNDLQDMLPDPAASAEWQHDWHLLRMVNKEDLGTVRRFLLNEVLRDDTETTEDGGDPKSTNHSSKPASVEVPNPLTAAPAGEPSARGAVGE